MSDDLEVRGGVGGVQARLDDLLGCARLLNRCATDLALLAALLGRLAADPSLRVTGLVAPLTLAVVDRTVLAATVGPDGLLAAASRLAESGLRLGLVVAAYRTADRAVDVALQQVELTAGATVGRLLAPLVLPGLTLAGGTAVLLPAARALPRALPGTAVGPVVGGVVGRVRAVGLPAGSGTGSMPGPIRAVGRLEDLPGWVRPAAEFLAGRPGPTEAAVAAVPGLVGGLLLPVPGPVGAVPGPVRDVPGVAGLVGRIGGPAVPGLREPARVELRMLPGREVRAPRDLAEVADRIDSCYPVLDASGRPVDPVAAASGRVRVDLVRHGPGRRAWVVSIPGQQVMSAQAGTNPFDLAGDVHAMAREDTAARQSVLAAMRSAGVPAGDPVLLAGHSQGGMTAAQLAADPSVRARYRITHVLTLGSPVAGYPVPEGVQVLSVEHRDDVVPRLDGRENPHPANWVTVGRQSRAPGRPADPVTAHDLLTYRRTLQLVDASADSSLQAWRRGLDPFLDRPGTTGWTLEFVTRRSRQGPGAP